jgi:hypothetical protein
MRSLRVVQTAVLVMLPALCVAAFAFPASAVPPSPSSTTTVTVPAPAAAKGAAPAAVVLHLEDLRLPPGSSGIVRVFVDLPPERALKAAEAEPSADDRHYLGYVTVLPKTSRESAGGMVRKQVTLDVTAKAAELTGKPRVTLTLVALGGPAADQLHTGRVYFADK